MFANLFLALPLTLDRGMTISSRQALTHFALTMPLLRCVPWALLRDAQGNTIGSFHAQPINREELTGVNKGSRGNPQQIVGGSYWINSSPIFPLDRLFFGHTVYNP